MAIYKAIQNSTADMMSYEVSGSLVDICKIIYPGEKKFSARNYEYAKEVFSHLLYTRIWADDMKTSVPAAWENECRVVRRKRRWRYQFCCKTWAGPNE